MRHPRFLSVRLLTINNHGLIFSNVLFFLFLFFFIISGTRIGQASECFVYWKDPVTNDTWGLNFTSPADARAFRECCVSLYPPTPAFSCSFVFSYLLFRWYHHPNCIITKNLPGVVHHIQSGLRIVWKEVNLNVIVVVVLGYMTSFNTWMGIWCRVVATFSLLLFFFLFFSIEKFYTRG